MTRNFRSSYILISVLIIFVGTKNNKDSLILLITGYNSYYFEQTGEGRVQGTSTKIVT